MNKPEDKKTDITQKPPQYGRHGLIRPQCLPGGADVKPTSSPVRIVLTCAWVRIFWSPQRQSQPAKRRMRSLMPKNIHALWDPPSTTARIILRDEKSRRGRRIRYPRGRPRVIDAKGRQRLPGISTRHANGIAGNRRCQRTVDSTETGNFNPDVVAATAFLVGEHIPVHARRGHTEFLAVPGSGGFDSVAEAASSAVKLPRSQAGLGNDEMLIKKSAALVLNWPPIETQKFRLHHFLP